MPNLLNLEDNLPNYQKTDVSVAADEFVNDISMNRCSSRLVENDIYLFQKSLAIERSLLDRQELDLSPSGRWESCYSTVQTNSSDWIGNQNCVASDNYPAASSINYLPTWVNGYKKISTGFTVADSSMTSTNDDTSIPTTKYLNSVVSTALAEEAQRVLQLEVTSVVPAPQAENMVAWHTDKIIKDSGYNVNSFKIFEAMWQLDFLAGTNGSITTCDGRTTQYVCDGGYTRAVTAVPDDGHTFVNWTGTLYSKTGTTSFTSTDNPLLLGTAGGSYGDNVRYGAVITANFSS